MRGMNKTVAYIIAGLIMLTSAYLPYLTGFRISRELLLGILIMVGAGAVMLRYTISGGLLVIYTAVTLYLSKSFGIEHHIYLLLSCSVLACVGICSRRRWADGSEIIYNTICVIAVVNAVLGFLQMVVGWQIPFKMSFRCAVGLMTNPNELSSLMAICLPFFFRKGWAYLIPIPIIGMVVSQSLQGPLMGSVVSLVYLWMRFGRKAVLYALIPVLIAGWAFITFADRDFSLKHHFDTRGATWQKTTIAAMEKPFMGWGWGQYKVVVPLITGPATLGEERSSVLFRQITDFDAMNRVLVKITGTDDMVEMKDFLYSQENNVNATMIQAHNEYVEAFFVFGGIGLFLMLAFVCFTVRKGLKAADKLPGLSFLAASLCAAVFFVWQLIPFVAITILLVSMIHGSDNNN